MAWSLDNAEGVKHLQRGLNFACWYSEDRFIAVTGVMDDDTTRSVVEFQRIFAMPQTGIADNALMDALEAEMVRKRITQW